MDREPNRITQKLSMAIILSVLIFVTSAFIPNEAFAEHTPEHIELLKNKNRGDRGKNNNRGNRDKARKEKRKERGNDKARDRTPPRRDRTQPDRPRRDRTTPDNPRRDRTQPDRPRRDRTTPDKPRRDRTQPDRPRRDRTTPDKPRRDRTQPDRPRRDRTQPDHPRRDGDRTERERRRRNQDRVKNDRRRRERERDRIDRGRTQREHARRRDRIRDRDRQQHRRQSRDRFRRHRQHHHHARRAIRFHFRWQLRYDQWRRHHGRWGHPGWPRDRINYPGQWPGTSHLWSIYDIINVSDNLETQFAHIYKLAYDGHDFDVNHHNGPVSKIATKAYALWYAAQVYSDAVEFYKGKLYYSIYELYNLEEAAQELEAELRLSRHSRHLDHHLRVGKFYINELLWQYRRQMGPIDEWRDRIDEGDEWRNDIGDEWDDVTDSYFTNTFSFWWDKPHRSVVWSLARPMHVGSITIEAVGLNNQQGKNGVAGVSEVRLNFVDGSQLNLVRTDHSKYSSRTGQIVLLHQGDHFAVNNEFSQIKVESIDIRADSWVDPDIDVDLKVSINSYQLN